METIYLNELKENKTFRISNNGNYVMPSTNRITIQGKTTVIAVWSVNGQKVLRIESTVPGSWRVVREKRKAHRFIPENPSELFGKSCTNRQYPHCYKPRATGVCFLSTLSLSAAACIFIRIWNFLHTAETGPVRLSPFLNQEKAYCLIHRI